MGGGAIRIFFRGPIDRAISLLFNSRFGLRKLSAPKTFLNLTILYHAMAPASTLFTIYCAVNQFYSLYIVLSDVVVVIIIKHEESKIRLVRIKCPVLPCETLGLNCETYCCSYVERFMWVDAGDFSKDISMRKVFGMDPSQAK